MSSDAIVITGAREHNLKGISVSLPRNKLSIITGLSGSGKSSLAFDTLYAEGQRRYVESLSAYARQFLDQMQKPDVEHIEGLSPAISIEQRVAGSNPRSIVATTTEIHDYLRLLYASIGTAHCPSCKRPVTRQSPDQIVDTLFQQPPSTKVSLLAPIIRGKKGTHEDIVAGLRKQGFLRIRVNGELQELEKSLKLNKNLRHTIDVVVDRLVIDAKSRSRITDSVELTLRTGQGTMLALLVPPNGTESEIFFSESHACPHCNLSFQELTPRCFSFNSPYGACPDCAGLGRKLIFDEALLIPNPELSIRDGAIHAWRRGGRRLIMYYKKLTESICEKMSIDMDTPFKSIPRKQQEILFNGSGDQEISMRYWRGGASRTTSKPFEGIIPNLQRRLDTTPSEYTREKLRSYMSLRHCKTCNGARLKPEIIACTVEKRSIVDITQLSIEAALDFFVALELSETQQHIAAEILKEIRRRLRFMKDVGLGYLTLDRESGTLSGGESQRIRLATQIGSGLVGVLYVLDEPSIGLHARDNERLIETLKRLRDVGNTVVVVEHDEKTIMAADHVIDLGPAAGRHGGEVMYQGPVSGLLGATASLTAQYISRQKSIPVPAQRTPPGDRMLTIHGATENNLKNVKVSFPLGLLTCVTGVSGSGKSTLVDDILRKALFKEIYSSKEVPGAYKKLEGVQYLDKVILIDQSPIGRTPRSNPVTYTGAFTHIRDLFSQTAVSKVRGYAPGRFSFNVKGGRCEACKGDGMITLEMHFLPDVYVTCEQCRGLRYNRETLEAKYKTKSISDVLAMTIEEALEFFMDVPAIASKLQTLSYVGLGYLQLGQSATTLSGGEAQRVKLSSELARRATGRTLYLLDEPTTGLHFADTHRLMDVLIKLRDAGNTVIIIEHNMDVIKCADYVIDLGPDGGHAGGRIVAVGTPEQVAACRESSTGQFLKEVLSS